MVSSAFVKRLNIVKFNNDSQFVLVVSKGDMNQFQVMPVFVTVVAKGVMDSAASRIKMSKNVLIRAVSVLEQNFSGRLKDCSSSVVRLPKFAPSYSEDFLGIFVELQTAKDSVISKQSNYACTSLLKQPRFPAIASSCQW
jgi:hypothetical protein